MKAKVRRRFRKAERGQALVEYVILIAVVALAALFVLGAFSDRLREMIAESLIRSEEKPKQTKAASPS